VKGSASAADQAVLAQLKLSTYDLPTRDKIPVICELFGIDGKGIALDVGLGTGYTTYRVFGNRPTVCIDIDAGNLRLYRDRLMAVPSVERPLCVVAAATALPFRAGLFRWILASEVLEHIEDDMTAAGELSRVLAENGAVVITVPYIGIGFTGFLEVFGIKTVHDYPGPERHVRPGYDEASLERLVECHGLTVAAHRYYLRLFTRLTTDLVSLAHIAYERLVHGRRSWTWADVASVEGGSAFRLYRLSFPLLWAVSRLDRVLWRYRGFGLVAMVTKRALVP
jgi:ubiquinone/menaquinone biosynthesis C-methylase UbiE